MKNLIRNRHNLFGIFFCTAILLLVGCDLGTYAARSSESAKTFKPAKPPAVKEMASEPESEDEK